MADQADTLRKLMQQQKTFQKSSPTSSSRTGSVRESHGTKPPRILTIASGKGGVGKTCLVANLGTTLARQGFKVLLIDCDFGLANLDILLNVQPSATLEQVLEGTATFQEAVVGIEPNLWLIPAVSGVIDGLMNFRGTDDSTRDHLSSLFEDLPWDMDYIILDIGAGIHADVLSLHHTAFETMVVLTPEPTSMTDAYGLIKLLERQVGIEKVGIIVNQVTEAKDAERIFQKLNDVARRFLEVELEYIGHWQKDEKISEAVMKRKILLDLCEGALSVPSLKLLAKRVQTLSRNVDTVRLGPVASTVSLRTGRFMDEPARRAPGNTARFWRTLLEVKA